jgi:hypothetical protein
MLAARRAGQSPLKLVEGITKVIQEMGKIGSVNIQSHRRTHLDDFTRVRDALTAASRQSSPSLASLF